MVGPPDRRTVVLPISDLSSWREGCKSHGSAESAILVCICKFGQVMAYIRRMPFFFLTERALPYIFDNLCSSCPIDAILAPFKPPREPAGARVVCFMIWAFLEFVEIRYNSNLAFLYNRTRTDALVHTITTWVA